MIYPLNMGIKKLEYHKKKESRSEDQDSFMLMQSCH